MAKTRKYRFALVGTDSLRGKEMKNVLGRKKLPLQTLEFFDPKVKEEYSKLTDFRQEPKVIHHLTREALEGTDLVFLAADPATNREYGRLAARSKFKAIDLAETFNGDEDVPLVVPGVNDRAIDGAGASLIANPNPVTIFLARLLHALRGISGIRKALAFVLRPASAFEEAGVQELIEQSCALLTGSAVTKKVFRDEVAFNILSRTEKTGSDGFSPQEKRILAETRRVLGAPDFPLSLSIVQAPVFHAYSIMVYVELDAEIGISDLERLFRENAAFEPANHETADQALTRNIAGKDTISIGSIKREASNLGSFWIWMVADNLTVGSALNAYEISKILFASSSARA